MTVTTLPPEIRRNWQGRPFVKQPDGTEVTYTRCTTYVEVLEDRYNLEKWKQRKVLVGAAGRPDLTSAALAHMDDKKELDKLCDAAREAAGDSVAARNGTTMHKLTEHVDRGKDLPQGLPAAVLAGLEKYRQATDDFKAVYIEHGVVMDKLRVHGTPDRVIRHRGKRYIGDVKTGNIELGVLKIAMQIAMYSRSRLYDVSTGERSDHGAEFNRGLIIHLPGVEDPADAACTLHWVDLEAGWAAVQVATRVREKRKLKFTDLTEPFGEDPAVLLERSIIAQIQACASREAVVALWTKDWGTDPASTLNAAAAAHIATLKQAS